MIKITKVSLAAYSIVCLLGCSSDSVSRDDALKNCLAQGGEVVTEAYDEAEPRELCVYTETATYDDGDHVYTHRCEIYDFYHGDCDEEELEEESTKQSTIELSTKSSSPDIRNVYAAQVEDILNKLGNTGYAHNKDGNFIIDPGVHTLHNTADHYNLFLDCSGYVGYYVVQGMTQGLYDQLTPSLYQCGERPLAADFADIFEDAPHATSHNAASMDDLQKGNACWGRVKHIEDALPGDILVYKHSKHIHGRKDCPGKNRAVHNTSGNTGHVLFVHRKPFRSNRCKANSFSCGHHQYVVPGEWQWVVGISDSTTSPHSGDSRHVGEDESEYNGNRYHAWAKVDKDGHTGVERCENGEYHRSCDKNGSTAIERAIINTKHDHTPTGIGAGKMYVNDDMKGYRSKYSADTVDEGVEVFVGRPIKCS